MDTYRRLRVWLRTRPAWAFDSVLALVVSLVPLWVLASVPPDTPGLDGFDGVTPVLALLTVLPACR